MTACSQVLLKAPMYRRDMITAVVRDRGITVLALYGYDRCVYKPADFLVIVPQDHTKIVVPRY